MKKRILWKILIYLIVYSVIGFLLETVYAIFTKGTLESRQSFIYGPFCIVYGIAAICLIFPLNKFKGKNIKLFFYGMIIGCIVEYFSSFFGELLMHIKWWDYKDAFLNINGRTCFYYAVMWGFLSIILINYFNPLLDMIINKIFKRGNLFFIKSATLILILFMLCDALISMVALDNFLNRVASNYDINIKGINRKNTDNIISKIYNDEKIMMTYPNMLVVNSDNEEIIYMESVLKDVKNYYYKFSLLSD